MSTVTEIENFVDDSCVATNHTASAFDAFGMIAKDELRRVIGFDLGFWERKSRAFNAKKVGGCLQFAVTIFFAGQAIVTP
ncbi:MAG: hypothetical protein ACD_62C00667G0001 [uncultured bacterium]|nr:MAG: hypothetical protein ACD_62C00667G0001 [uncultured bacterium]